MIVFIINKSLNNLLIMSDQKYLDVLLKICEDYIRSETYVYKMCYNFSDKYDSKQKWLVVFEKLKETKTNEKRKGVFDRVCAKFRADTLKVVDIIDIYNPSASVEYITHRYNFNEIKYQINRTVTADNYNEKIDKICTGGIHYFKTLITAFYYRFMPTDYTGMWIEWDDNGKKVSECEYTNGERLDNSLNEYV